IAKLALPRTGSYAEGEAATLTLFNTKAGMILGTAQYMSPEQARGLDVDARTDIWSLGCVLYEMVAGRQPFVGATAMDVMTSILNREPDSLVNHTPEGPEELELIVSRALRKDREERYQTVADLLIDLKELKSELELQTKRISAPRKGIESRQDSIVLTTSAVPETSIAVLY